MKLLAYFRSLGARFLRRHQIENEMEEELWSHIQLRAEHLQHSGMNRAEAERQARIEFGCPEQFKENVAKHSPAISSTRCTAASLHFEC